MKRTLFVILTEAVEYLLMFFYSLVVDTKRRSHFSPYSQTDVVETPSGEVVGNLFLGAKSNLNRQFTCIQHHKEHCRNDAIIISYNE